MAKATCVVVFDDGAPCIRPRHGALDWCEPCYSWSYRRGGTDPVGRTRRGCHRRCTVVFEGGIPCRRSAKNRAKIGDGWWCGTCYNWSRTNGWADPNGRSRKRRPGGVTEELHRAANATTDECIILAGYANRPSVEIARKTMQASRAVWIIAHGDPGNAKVLHTCHKGEEGCININCLYLGDPPRNAQDMVEAGRSAWGMRNARAVLTDDQICAIRRRYVRGNRWKPGNSAELASEFGIGRSTVLKIVRRDLRPHLAC